MAVEVGFDYLFIVGRETWATVLCDTVITLVYQCFT